MAFQTVHACAIYVHCTNVIYSDYTPHTRHIHHTHVTYTTHVLNTPHAPYKPQLRHMTVSNCLFKKEQCEWFARDLSESLANNEQFAHKICMFHMFLTVFPLFYAQERIAPVALCSFLKSKLSDLLPLLFTKEGPWATRSGCSWQKSDGSNSLFFASESLFRSFALWLTKMSRKTDERIPNPGHIHY